MAKMNQAAAREVIAELRRALNTRANALHERNEAIEVLRDEVRGYIYKLEQQTIRGDGAVRSAELSEREVNRLRREVDDLKAQIDRSHRALVAALIGR